VKNSVYVLPRSEQSLEDFQWVRGEIVSGGGDASVCEARFVEGLSDAGVEELFNGARAADYAGLIREARRIQQGLQRRRPAARRGQAAAKLLRLRKRLGDVAALDFFGASGRDTVEGLIVAVEAALRPAPRRSEAAAESATGVRGRTWVTRRGVQVDRIASAWLIRRFIDPQARFKFVDGRGYRPEAGELRFDMFDAEFTHEGERCTFETLLRRAALDDPALTAIGEIVHDIDLKDERYERPETAGVATLMGAFASGPLDDEARIARGADLLDGLYDAFTTAAKKGARK
jgi:hypothetical protein